MPLFIGISWQLFLLCCQHWWLPNSSSFNNGGCQPLTSWMGAHAMATTQQCVHIRVPVNNNEDNKLDSCGIAAEKVD